MCEAPESYPIHAAKRERCVSVQPQVMTDPRRVRLNDWHRLIALMLIGVFFAQAVVTAPQLSLTADEPVYMGAGYAFLRTADLRMATAAQHPPLMQELVALPLLLQPGPQLAQVPGWDTSEMARFAPSFVAWYGDELDAATFAARIPVVWVALLWAAFLFRWAADCFGPWGGIVALTMFTFDPNILAHSTLATNDVGFAAFSLITLFAVDRLRRRASWRYVMLAGLALGASLSAKSSGFFTALTLVALLPLWALIRRDRRAHHLVRAGLHLALILCVGIAVLWATYGFEIRPVAVGRTPVPMATQWEVWREMREHLNTGHTAYLMGQVSEAGWSTYYPVAFALKTPLLTLALLAMGLVKGVTAGPRRWLAMLPLWLYSGGYVAAALLSSVSTGYRFLLPVVPLGFILIAGLFHRDGMQKLPSPTLRWGGWMVLALMGLATSLRSYPDYIAYFNLLAGGPGGGHRYLVDSNLDWGQSFKRLENDLARQGVERVWLSYYTYTDPALYGVEYQPIAPSPDALSVLPSRFNPAPGIYAIGATTLQGVMMVDPDSYDWFRNKEPVSRPGVAMFVYEVPPRDRQPAWLAQCTVPVVPLTSEAATEGFGQRALRLVTFDCTSAWLYPGGARTPGWYALFRDTANDDDPFIQARLATASLSYEQRRASALPPFAIYEQSSLPTPQPSTPASSVEVGHLSFLDAVFGSQGPWQVGQTVEMETWWRVDSLPARPLSILMHLVGPENTIVAIGDGLGVPIEQWQEGDVIVQRHSLELPADAPPGEYSPMTGVYWLDTLERWEIEGEAEPVEDRLTLPSISVEAAR